MCDFCNGTNNITLFVNKNNKAVAWANKKAKGVIFVTEYKGDKAIKEYELNTHYCPFCGEDITTEHKYAVSKN